MATYLLCSPPLTGHVGPLVTIGKYLMGRGHRVVLLTGSRFSAYVTEHGLEFAALTGVADFDESDPSSFVPDVGRYSGLALSQYQIQSTFIRPIPDQHRALRALLDSDRIDAILADATFGGVLPTLLGRAGRPPILGAGSMPLTQRSRDVPPPRSGFDPSTTPFGHFRNRLLNAAGRVLFAKTQRLAAEMVAEVGGPRLTVFAMDLSSSFDRFLQLAPEEFEYPRSDRAANTAFVGAVRSSRAEASGPLPPWWDELSDGRAVVHVTQGTLDNNDFSRLLRPVLDALAGQEVYVVASTGGPPPEEVGPVPANARVVSFIPYEQLLPVTNLMVTNGGYGGVLHALRYGIPLVVAGDTEDKPEVAARVAYFGVGIDLKSGRPTPSEIGSAVSQVLGDSGFRDRALLMAEAMARYQPLQTIETELARTTAQLPRTGSDHPPTTYRR